MKVSIIGAGMAGLALAWHLLEKNHTVTLFDPRGIGGGASGVSTGLLYPYPGRLALRSWAADEGMKATLDLIQVAEETLGRPVALRNGVLRIAVSNQQKKDFKQQGTLWSEEEVIARLPLATKAPALWVPEGITVFSRMYLQGLWQACEKRGAKLELQAIQSLSELNAFDATILATGAETLQFEECRHLSLQTAIGQSLLCRWPEPLPMSIVSYAHLSPTEDPQFCTIGSTYEHTEKPDPKKARELLEKAAEFYPPARDFEIVEVRSGVRLAPRIGYRPIAQKIAPKAWVFTAFGSRGLLYHAMLAKNLVNTLE
jgi:glycine/D-amino acid oxidase-like deaminating enzyme